MWVIKNWVNEINETDHYNVGYYDPKGSFHVFFTYDTLEQASYRTSYLNGGPNHGMREALEDTAAALEAIQKIQSGILDILEKKWG